MNDGCLLSERAIARRMGVLDQQIQHWGYARLEADLAGNREALWQAIGCQRALKAQQAPLRCMLLAVRKAMATA